MISSKKSSSKYFRILSILPLIILSEFRIGHLLNQIDEWEPCLSIFENINELVIANDGIGYNVLFSDRPVIDFKNLSYLRLVGFVLHGETWRQLLVTVGDSLIQLHLDNKGRREMGFGYKVLLRPLPNLKSLKLDAQQHRLEMDFVAELRRTFLAVDPWCVNKDGANALKDAISKGKICGNLALHPNCSFDRFISRPQWFLDVVDEEGRFELVKLFPQEIKRLHFSLYGDWYPRHTVA